jgi:hypothetical protein
MNDAWALLTADAAEIVDVVQQGIHECAARVSRRRMDDHAGRFVDHDEIVILIEDRQRQRFRLRFRFGRLGDGHRHLLTGSYRLVRPGGPSFEQHQALLDQALNLRSRLLGQHRDEEHIQPCVLAIVGNGEGVRVQAARFRALFGVGSFRRAR